MMKRIELEINGVAYPCSPSMGAMLRFKQETGREINEIDANSFSDLCTYLWCCVVSACNREKIPFTYSMMDFADNISPGEMSDWTGVILSEAPVADEESEKKSH